MLSEPPLDAIGSGLTCHAVCAVGQLPNDVLELFAHAEGVDPQLGLAWLPKTSVIMRSHSLL